MQFASFQFILFFSVVSLLYFYLPRKLQWLLLLAASVLFYMSFIPGHILAIAFAIVVNYLSGILIEKNQGQKKKALFVAALIVQIGVLVVFKYASFIGQVFGFEIATSGATQSSSLIAPLGISFYTFMSLSYLIEVYSGRLKAERHIGYLALFSMFFAQIVAGPIERPKNTIPQFKEPHAFDYARVADGLKLMAFGFFKKLVIADRLAAIVNNVYDNPTNFIGPQLILATILFAIQVYCDFSGYSDIVIGAAQVLGIRLMENFKQPYFSRSVTEFWQRWHISLSTWLRDYLYYPMARKLQRPSLRWMTLLLTFLISGIWHGAAWSFVIWGGLHGMFLVLEVWGKGYGGRLVNFLRLTSFPKVVAFLQSLATFAALCFAWIFFRANHTNEALYIVSHLHTGMLQSFRNLPNFQKSGELLGAMGFSPSGVLIALLSIGALFVIERWQHAGSVRKLLAQKPEMLRWAVYYALIIVIVFFGVYGSSGFIYFQF